MSPRRGQRAVDPRVRTGDQVAPRLPARLMPRLEAVRPPAHDRAIEVRGTGRMMVGLAVRAIVGALSTAGAFALFVVAILLDWPGAAVFWIFVLVGVVALTVGRRPVRAVRAWRHVRRTPWRYYDAKVSPGSAGRLVELLADGEKEPVYLRLYPDSRATEVLKWSATYARVWYAGAITGRGIVVPAGGGAPIPARRVVPLPMTRTAGSTTGSSVRRFVPYGMSEWRMRRRLRAAEKAAIRARKSRDRALATADRATARRAEWLRKHPPKPGRVVKKPAKPLPVSTRTPKPPRTGRGGGRDLSRFLPKDT